MALVSPDVLPPSRLGRSLLDRHYARLIGHCANKIEHPRQLWTYICHRHREDHFRPIPVDTRKLRALLAVVRECVAIDLARG